MALVITFTTFAIIAPHLFWVRRPQVSSLFLGAAIVWAGYSTVIVLLHGPTQTFDYNNSQVTRIHLFNYWYLVGPFVVAAGLLFFVEKWPIPPNVLAIQAVFWFFNGGCVASMTVSELYVGYSALPIWYTDYRHDELHFLGYLSSLSVLLPQFCHLAFFSMMGLAVLRNAPAAIRRTLIYLRYL